MSAIEEASPKGATRAGEAMPRIATVQPSHGFSVVVTWAAGPRVGQTDILDLAPIVMTLRFYVRLRHDAALFASVAITEDGSALLWDQGNIGMGATTVERLARECARRASGHDLSARLMALSIHLRSAFETRPVPPYSSTTHEWK
jgi:hypothetical protein